MICQGDDVTAVLIGHSPACSTSCMRIQARASGRSSRKRPSGNKPSPSGLNNQIQSSECSSAQNLQVAGFSEYDFIDSKKFVEADDRKADAARDFLTVRQDKRHVFFLATNANSFERPLGHPSKFTPRIYQELRYDNRASPIGRVLNLAFCVKGFHVENFGLLARTLKTTAANLSSTRCGVPATAQLKARPGRTGSFFS